MDGPQKVMQRVVDETFLLQERHINDGTNFTYSGYADPSVEENDPGWLIVYFAYDANNFLISKKFAG